MMTYLSAPLPCDPDRVSPYLLIGSELALYREVLAGVFTALRPEVPVHAVAPAELDATVLCLRPWLVICSAVSTVVEGLAHAWILIHAEGSRDATVSVGGERRTIPSPTIEELLRLVDEVWGDAPAAAARG